MQAHHGLPDALRLGEITAYAGAEWLKQLLTNRQIADRLSITPSTIDTHLTRIMRKLGTDGRVKTVLYAIKHGLVAGPV